MTMLIAKTVIHRTVKPGKPGDKTKGIKATPPEQDVIQPGEIFEAKDAEERAELIGLGAAEDAPKGATKDTQKRAKASAAAPKAAAAKKAAAAGDSGKAGETTTTGKTTEGGDGSEMV